MAQEKKRKIRMKEIEGKIQREFQNLVCTDREEDEANQNDKVDNDMDDDTDEDVDQQETTMDTTEGREDNTKEDKVKEDKENRGKEG